MQGDLGILREAAYVQGRGSSEGWISLGHEELNLEAGIAQEDPAQVAEFPPGHALDIEDLDFLIEDADVVAGGVVDLRNLAFLQVDLEAELQGARFLLRDEHEFLELDPVLEGDLLALLLVFVNPEVELDRLAGEATGLDLDPQGDAVSLEYHLRGDHPTDMNVGWGRKSDRNSVEGNAAFLQPAGHVDGILALDPGEVTDDHGTGKRLSRETIHGIFNSVADLGRGALCHGQGGAFRIIPGGTSRGGPWVLSTQLGVEGEEPKVVSLLKLVEEFHVLMLKGGPGEVDPAGGAEFLLQIPCIIGAQGGSIQGSLAKHLGGFLDIFSSGAGILDGHAS